MDFVHLHLHTEYSLLDGACRINEVVNTAKSLSQKALAITDHGVMYGAVDFYSEAVNNGIKPIIGCEVYVAPRSLKDKDRLLDNKYNHLILLCKNEIGYKNLIYLVSKSFTEGFYMKPRIDKAILKEHCEGLICLSACMAGEIPQKILNNNFDGALTAAQEYSEIFGKDNFYLEIQRHFYKEDDIINNGLIEISNRLSIPLVATNDVHYTTKDDAVMQQILVNIGTNHTVNEDNPMLFKTNEFYLKSGEEMSKLFADIPEAISNTVKIADMCNFNFEFGKIKLPYFNIGNKNHFDYFKEKCYKGLQEKVSTNKQEYIKRLEYELSVVEKMGYTDYYLIVADFVNYAKSKQIPVGPGRGSGAGSLAAYCLGITGIDPIKHNLLFERFLNPERVSMPDFDVDFCYVRRQEVIDYVKEKYGEDHVAQIATFGTLKAKAAVRDVGRAYAVDYAKCDTVAKLIPAHLGTTIKGALEESEQLLNLYNTDADVKKIIDMSIRVEGMPRHVSTHAAGVVITDKTVDSYVPLAVSDNNALSQYTMNNLDKLGLLKMDFLGLRNLTVIDECEKNIKTYINKNFSINNIDYNDADTLAMMAAGDTNGVFQYESAGMKATLRSMKPECLEDLIAIISLYRPGPRQYIPKYVHFRHNQDKIEYSTNLLKPILDVTYGCIVYQEQVMQIFTTVAGYSLGRADIVRRAMSKKKHDVLQKERQTFLSGAVKNGIKEEDANKLFEEITAFSSYAFNKSHATAYAYVAFQTAYLKCHYPKPYMSALLNSVLDFHSKLTEYLNECVRLGFSILPPSVNYSESGFTYSEKGIVFGLMAVKNLGSNIINNIIEERQLNGNYKNLSDFLTRANNFGINRKALESLIKCGAFDCFNYSRRALILNIEKIIGFLDRRHKNYSYGQISLFGSTETSFNIENCEEFDKKELLLFEKEITDFYISGHPLENAQNFSKSIGAFSVLDVIEKTETEQLKDGDNITILGLVSSYKTRKTKNNKIMANAVIEDISGSINAIIFERTLTSSPQNISVGKIYTFMGKISIKEESTPEIIVNNFTLVDENRFTKTDLTNIKQVEVVINNAEMLKKAKLLSNLYFGDDVLILVCNGTKYNYNISFSQPIVDFLEYTFGKNNVKIIK